MAVLFRLTSVLLAGVLATTGLPPCLGMGMEMGPAAGHRCCDEDCPATAADVSAHRAPTPAPDCCAWGQAPKQRTPLDRPASAASPVALEPVRMPAPFDAPAVALARLTGSPPGPPAVRPHLLHAVLLI